MQMSFIEPVRIHFYQILFSLPKNVEDIIKIEKDNVITTFGNLRRADSIPHITLCEFAVPEDYSEKVIVDLGRVLEKLNSFNISCNGYYTWSSNKLIAAKVEPTSVFQGFFEVLSSVKETYSFFKKEKQFHISKTPHITIALGGDKFEYLEAEYQDKKLDLSFTLETIIIRKSIDGGVYKTIKTIVLK